MNGLELFFEEIDPFEIRKEFLLERIYFLIKNENKTFGDISIIFCSDDYLLKINEQYLGHDNYTDIVTFDYVEKSVISGDLFISIERVTENAILFSTSLMEELYRVIIHGILHLIGYKDKTVEDKKQMREKENFYLNGIDFNKENV